MSTQIMAAKAVVNSGEHIAVITVGGLMLFAGILLLILHRMEIGRGA